MDYRECDCRLVCVGQPERRRPGQDTHLPHQRGHPHVRHPERHPAHSRAARPLHSSPQQLFRVEFRRLREARHARPQLDRPLRLPHPPRGVEPPSSAPTMVYGAKQGQSTAAVSAAMATYTSQPEYAWLGTGAGGFSQTLSFPGATNPIGWVTRNQYSGSGFASGIGSFTNALDQAISTAAVSPTWPGLTSGTGPNWTTAGFSPAKI